jgi:hypothetical protein
MENPIKILHIDLNWKVVYLVIRAGILIKTSVSLETAVSLLKKVRFDLIIDEPQHKAILTPQATSDKIVSTLDSIPNGDSAQETMENRKAAHL